MELAHGCYHDWRFNTAVGWYALGATTTGDNNTAIGGDCFRTTAILAGGSNTAVGKVCYWNRGK